MGLCWEGTTHLPALGCLGSRGSAAPAGLRWQGGGGARELDQALTPHVAAGQQVSSGSWLFVQLNHCLRMLKN